MVANGDADKAIYMTELGWSTTGAECATGAWAGQKAAGVDDPTQATYLERAYHCLAQPQYSYVKVAIGSSSSTTAPDDPRDNYGLLNSTFAPSPRSPRSSRSRCTATRSAVPAADAPGARGGRPTVDGLPARAESPGIAGPLSRPARRVSSPAFWRPLRGGRRWNTGSSAARACASRS